MSAMSLTIKLEQLLKVYVWDAHVPSVCIYMCACMY